MRLKDKKQFEEINVFGTGKPNKAFAQYFKGESFLNPLTNSQETAVFLANVTFEPGCRNNWHIHHAKNGGGQLLICTAGEGWYQEENKPPVSHCRNGYYNSGRVETLARSEKRQLVFSYRCRSAGRVYFKPMVRACK